MAVSPTPGTPRLWGGDAEHPVGRQDGEATTPRDKPSVAQAYLGGTAA